MTAELQERRNPAEPERANRGRQVIREILRNRLALASLVFLTAVSLFAFLAPLLPGLDPYQVNLAHLDEGASWQYVFGTDGSGRDTFARTVYATRTSLIVGFSSVGIYICIGTVLGTVAGFFGGAIDAVISRLVDALLSIPLLLLVTVFVAFLQPGVLTVILVIGLLGWPATVRITRAQTLSLRESDFIVAARVTGLTAGRILRVHVLPNLAAPVIVVASLGVGTAILLEAALGFLGLGVRPPTPSLGVMVTAAVDSVVLRNHPWQWLPPSIVLALLVMAVNILGDAVRDALAPRLGGTKGL